MLETKVCEICGREFEALHSRMKYCTPACRYKAQWQNRKESKAQDSKSPYIRPEKYKPKARVILITDEEQRKIDHKCFLKTAVHFESKHYKPGDPEWEKICSTITPLDKIPRTRYNEIEINPIIIPSRMPLGGLY